MQITIPVYIAEWHDDWVEVELNSGTLLKVFCDVDTGKVKKEKTAWSHSSESAVQSIDGFEHFADCIISQIHLIGIYEGCESIRIDQQLEPEFKRQLAYQIGQEAIRLEKLKECV